MENPDDLYFIRIADGPVKIGRSGDVPARFRSIKCSLPYEAELIGTLPGQGKQEARWHSAFRHQRIRGEWFAWSDRIAAAISGALHGDYADVRLMPREEVNRRYEAILGQRFAVAQAAAHSVHGRFA